MVYAWYSSVANSHLHNCNVYFCFMNFTVHTFMYSWYAAARTGWRSPKWLMMFITMIQIVQMIFGLAIALIAQQDDPRCIWRRDDPVGANFSLWMYFSYFVLFCKLFVDNYVCSKKKRSKKP